MPDPTEGGASGRGGISPADKSNLEARVSELDGKLGRAKAAHTPRGAGGDVLGGRGMAYGMRMASEFVAAIVVGGLIGYGLDLWLKTTPWLFLLFFVLGLVAGVVNITRGYRQVQAEISAKTGGRIGKDLPNKDDD